MTTFGEKVEMSLENWEYFVKSIKEIHDLSCLDVPHLYVTLVLLLKKYTLTRFLQEEAFAL